MKNTKIEQPPLGDILKPGFSSGFLKDHAGKILLDPKIAIVELVANCWDAGADLVEITWPEEEGQKILIKDNGTGMTREEFENRWNILSYNRLEAQGADVVFPAGNNLSSRKAFGRNGKGRHGLFCFSDEYFIETTKAGKTNTFKVARSEIINEPFQIFPISTIPSDGNGVILTANADKNLIKVDELKELIGSKFIADPSFRIMVNSDFVELTDLQHLSNTIEIPIDGIGIVKIHHFDTKKRGRTSKQHGVAWWVNKRLVGKATWKGFDNNPYLDARKSEAKQHTFIVEADMLASSVEADWDSFSDTPEFERVSSEVKEVIHQQLRELFSDIQKDRKKEAIKINRDEVKELEPSSRKMIGTLLDELQLYSPSITQRDLNATVQIITKLEKSRSQFMLLEQLSKLSSDDLDGLSELLSQWSVSEARYVLDVLKRRLKLIEMLETLVEDPTTNELQTLQPLFDQGLWIFGPEYESVDFMSNRSLLTIIRNFFNDKQTVELKNPRKRPDFVVLEDSTINIYSSDSFNEQSEVNGVAKVLIIELKRGGFKIGREERRQAQDYASELRKSGKVGKFASIVGFVLGATIEEDAQEEVKEGKTIIYPRTYGVILRQAHARTFNLQEKINHIRADKGLDGYDIDRDVEAIINEEQQYSFSPELVTD